MSKHRLSEQTYSCQGEWMGERNIREVRINVDTLLYLKQISNKVLLYSTGNCAQCYVAAWMGGSLGENGYMYMYVYIYVYVSLHCLLEIITTLFVNWLYPNTK